MQQVIGRIIRYKHINGRLFLETINRLSCSVAFFLLVLLAGIVTCVAIWPLSTVSLLDFIFPGIIKPRGPAEKWGFLQDALESFSVCSFRSVFPVHGPDQHAVDGGDCPHRSLLHGRVDHQTGLPLSPPPSSTVPCSCHKRMNSSQSVAKSGKRTFLWQIGCHSGK